jgi:pimeloyl-ACP methyl ester carboxylesterase
MSPERFTVRSQDGIDLSVQKTGAGPALLLIHGAMLNGSLSWGAVMPKFAERFTVYAMDRRGRAPSGDAQAYSIANESDDIVRVVEAIGGPVIVLAHSYGALASLDAIDHLKTVSHLMLYEPPVTAEGARPEAATVLAHLDSALADGDHEKIVMTFLTEQVRAPANRAAMMKSSPIWPTVLLIAPTLPRESRAVNTYRVSIDRLANCEIPTTVLLGSVTVGIMHDAAFFLRDTIPGCRLVILEGQGHGAMLDAPEFFATKILEIAK